MTEINGDPLLVRFYEHMEWLATRLPDWREADDADDDERRYQSLSTLHCAADELCAAAAEIMRRLRDRHRWTNADLARIHNLPRVDWVPPAR